jgi:hypothetical protein
VGSFGGRPIITAATDAKAFKELRGIVSGARPNLNNNEANVLEEFIAKFLNVFTTNSGEYKRTDQGYHRIDTGDTNPIHQPPSRLSVAKQAKVNGMLEDMKKRGYIEEMSSPWSSPVVLVRKKNLDLLISVDYRRLNDVTKKGCFPLPRIDDTLDTLAGGKWFSVLDMKS